MTETENGFANLGLDSRLVDALTQFGYVEPTPIQKQAIPHIVEGRDLIGLAGTGTGKTAAFALPLLHRLATGDRTSPSILILVPTRELCLQVATAVSRYGKPFKVKVVPVYGGAEFGEQVRGLHRGADVVVATPGRALDHLRRGTMNLANIQAVVLDEADEMLDMGFAEDLEAILSGTPNTRQTLLFSATMPPRIAAIARQHQTDPVRVTVARPATAAGEAPKVRQTVYLVPPDFKSAALARILDHEAPGATIVFCRTRHETEFVADALAARGFRPESLHGGLSQEQRDRVMRKFREGTTNLLVATDVAARGLDISHLTHVVNYGVPQSSETYVHRTGRIGRAGREGVALTVMDPREQAGWRSIERAMALRTEFAKVPSVADLRLKRMERVRDQARELVEKGGLEAARALLAPLAAKLDPIDLAAAALTLAAQTGRGDDGPEIPALAPPRSIQTRGEGDARRPVLPSRRGARGMTRLTLDVGRLARVSRRDIVAAIESEVGLGSRDLGAIDVADRFSTIEVPDEAVDHVLETLDGIRLRGRKVVVRRA